MDRKGDGETSGAGLPPEPFGRGLCTELLAGDDWGYPVARAGGDLTVPAVLEGEAREAVSRCPALALRLIPGRR